MPAALSRMRSFELWGLARGSTCERLLGVRPGRAAAAAPGWWYAARRAEAVSCARGQGGGAASACLRHDAGASGRPGRLLPRSGPARRGWNAGAQQDPGSGPACSPPGGTGAAVIAKRSGGWGFAPVMACPRAAGPIRGHSAGVLACCPWQRSDGALPGCLMRARCMRAGSPPARSQSRISVTPHATAARSDWAVQARSEVRPRATVERVRPGSRARSGAGR